MKPIPTAEAQTSVATTPIRVALVEDDRTQRESILTLLREQAGFEIVGAFSTAAEARQALPQSRPDVALVDISLHRERESESGIELVRDLKPRLPETQFMMLTVLEDADRLFAALEAGATGYLIKRDAQDRLAVAVREIHAGGSPMSSGIARYVVGTFTRPAPKATEEHHLSPRENEILNELAKGQLYKEIAESLHIGIGTVRTHIRRIYQKLHARNRAEAVRKTGRG